MVKVLAIAPIMGLAGDSVNERQLIFVLARYVNEVYVISPIGITQIFKRTYMKILQNRPPNVRIILIPFKTFPMENLWFINMLLYYFCSVFY